MERGEIMDFEFTRDKILEAQSFDILDDREVEAMIEKIELWLKSENLGYKESLFGEGVNSMLKKYIRQKIKRNSAKSS